MDRSCFSLQAMATGCEPYIMAAWLAYNSHFPLEKAQEENGILPTKMSKQKCQNKMIDLTIFNLQNSGAWHHIHYLTLAHDGTCLMDQSRKLVDLATQALAHSMIRLP